MIQTAARPETARLEPDRACVHDLRNLFAVVASAKFLLERSIDGQKTALVINALTRVAVEGKAITDALLSRATRERVSTIDAASEMRDLSTLLGVLERPGIRIDISRSTESSWVCMTAPEFAAVVVELVTNATSAGATEINIRSAPLGRLYWLLVADNGRGFNASSSNADSKGLHGNGLSRIAELASRAGGKIKTKSQPNLGSVVAVTLPLMPAQDSG